MLKFNLADHEHERFSTAENYHSYGIGTVSHTGDPTNLTYKLRQSNGLMMTVNKDEFQKVVNKVGEMRLRNAYAI